MSPAAEHVIQKLEEHGLLLESDPYFPSVAALVAGAPVTGSWWGHAKGHEIFRVLRELAQHPDVIFCKLAAGKVTAVHRKLWPAVLSIGRSREPWQLNRLSRAARSLLDRVTKEGRLQTSGDAVRELEKVLLVFAEQIHTESGAHAKVVESWDAWAKRAGVTEQAMWPDEAKRVLENAVSTMNQGAGGRRRLLPWT